MAESAKEKSLMTIKEVCREFNVHPNTLRNWDRSGKLKAMRVGPRKDRRYPRDKVFAFFYGTDTAAEEPAGGEELTPDFKDLKPLGSYLPRAKED